MVQENNTFDVESGGLSQFNQVFHKYFPTVTIPKASLIDKCIKFCDGKLV